MSDRAGERDRRASRQVLEVPFDYVAGDRVAIDGPLEIADIIVTAKAPHAAKVNTDTRREVAERCQVLWRR